MSSDLIAEPLHARLLVKRFEPKKKSGSVHLPDIAQQQNSWAEVVSIGPDVTAVQVGDEVVISLYGGTPVEVDGAEYLVIDEKELLLKIPLKAKLASK